jgi:choline dehydrogenase-like flavoprotein
VIIDGHKIEAGAVFESDICVVGGGAGGITLALELAAANLDVILLEGGSTELDDATQDLYKGTLVNSGCHAPLHESRHRQLGGTTTVWGGRCLPLDDIDFEERDYVDLSGWPFSKTTLEPFYRRAQVYCEVGEYLYSSNLAVPSAQRDMIPEFPDGEVVTSALERWGPPTNFGRRYRRQLEDSPSLRLFLNSNCTSLDLAQSSDRISQLTVSSLKRNNYYVKAKDFILAAGCLETTRLLLASNYIQKDGIGNHSGWLGRGYMGHIYGSIAKIKLKDRKSNVVYGFEKTRDGIYCRRRFWIPEAKQRERGILNFVASLDNSPKHDPVHGSGVLSMSYLALQTPGLRDLLAPGYQRKLALGRTEMLKKRLDGTDVSTYGKHLRNVISDFPAVLSVVPRWLYQRYVQKPRIPGFVIKSKNNVYDLRYCSEQSPNRDSRVYLSREKDSLGMPRLTVDYRWKESDIESTASAHELIDAALRRSNVGELEYKRADREEHILDQVGDGVHQAGTTRMSIDPKYGVVDPNCRVHGMENLYVASSAVFPTCGQANPVLTIVAMAIRLADHLRELRRVKQAARETVVEVHEN